MKLLFDFFPVLLFFIIFKLFGIYPATVAAIIGSAIQVLVHWIAYRTIEKMHTFTLLAVLILGGATLLFKNPVFIKWKPTGIYWLTSIFFLVSHYFAKKPLIRKMMEKNLTLPDPVWYRLNAAWICFFVLMGAVNIIIAYHFSTNAWVNFKFFGGLGLTLVFVILQSIYLSKYMTEDEPLSGSKDNS